ncbi:MAG TPA: site-2 protease family protein [Vicinamibacterales bacterium]|nr:site-2 protease family protein [Vicinamibacterales bacterium]
MSLEAVVPAFIILIASLSFHEAAHAWAADRLGDPTARMLGRLTLNPLAHIDWIGTVLFPLVGMLSGLPLIGWAKPVPVDTRNLKAPRRDFALVALAGPVSNVLLAFVAAVLLKAQGGLVPDEGQTVVTVTLYTAVILNTLLAVFNMLPVPPLDGGNVLAGIVPESVARLIDQMRPYGFFLLYALLLLGVLDLFVWPVQRFLGSWLI